MGNAGYIYGSPTRKCNNPGGHRHPGMGEHPKSHVFCCGVNAYRCCEQPPARAYPAAKERGTCKVEQEKLEIYQLKLTNNYGASSSYHSQSWSVSKGLPTKPPFDTWPNWPKTINWVAAPRHCCAFPLPGHPKKVDPMVLHSNDQFTSFDFRGGFAALQLYYLLLWKIFRYYTTGRCLGTYAPKEFPCLDHVSEE